MEGVAGVVPPAEAEKATALLRDRYTTALLAGDQAEAARVVSDALDRDIEVAPIYLEILAPALARIGDAWMRGDLNIADEHLATSITLGEMARVRNAVYRRGRLGASVIVAAVEGEEHAVAARMIADLFAIEGWDVAHLGENTPAEDLVAMARSRDADLVVLSLSHPDRLAAARQTVEMLKALDEGPVVFVGGRGLPQPGTADALPADFVSSNPVEALRTARELLGLHRERLTLEGQLEALGRRVQELRKARGWSQQKLAAEAGLDRTYLGTVEQGRQNITIGAALRLAEALEKTLPELIGPR
ncbi:MAG: helix-turn-helix domain-containing protein [Dehalococcoidia bacterium]|nr:helix-turn-helix domain-containing protein [Dehalococcoidia bacterium]